MITRYIFIGLAVPLLLLAGCAKQSDTPEDPARQAMRFNAFLQEGDKVRPLAPATRTIPASIDNGYYLYVSKYNTAEYLCDNMKVAVDGTMEADAYWLQGLNNYRVEAYALPNGSKLEKFTDQNKVFLKYVVADDPALQEDLLTAYIENLVIDQDRQAINLYFRHALSRIVFQLLRTKNGPSLYDVSVQLTYTANSVRKSLNVYPASSSVAPAVPAYHAGSYTLREHFIHSSSDTQPVELTDLILVPQTFPKGAITVTMSYKSDPAAPESERKTLTTELNSFTTYAGEQIEIKIAHNVEVNQLVVQGITLVPWVTTSGLLDIYK